MTSPCGKRLYIIGAGGHAHVIASAATLCGYVPWFIDVSSAVASCTLSEDEFFSKNLKNEEWGLICGVGSVKSSTLRAEIIKRFDRYEDRFVSIIHPKACLAESVRVGKGVFINQGAQVVCGVDIKDHAIVNTGVVVDHDCILGVGSHIAPGVVLSGSVKVGANTHIGTGACVIENCEISENVTIGAGAVVVQSIKESGGLWIGVPAKRMRK